MVRLTFLRIDRFRNVKPGTELRFGPTFNVLLGKNATGKSTLLDLVAAVTNDDLSAYANEDAGFDLTWCLEEGELQIELHVVRTPAKSAVLPEGIRQEKEFDDRWTITLRFHGNETDRFEVMGSRGLWKPVGDAEETFDVNAGLARGGVGWRTLLSLAGKLTAHSTKQHAMARVGAALRAYSRAGSAGRFDEALASFDAITRSPLVLSHKDAGGGFVFGPWVLVNFMMAERFPAFGDPLVIPFEHLGAHAQPGSSAGVLHQIPAFLGFASAEIRPRVMARAKDNDDVTTTCEGFDCLFRRADGSQISHQLLSFGQKRLFSFLWYLAVRDRLPIVADELLNGLHHEWIEICFNHLRERQSFLATQHPLLLDHIPIESPEAVRTTFIRCAIETGPDGREQLAWRNFTEEEAERFFTAYQTGIQQVSEVLRSEGLW